MSPAAPRVAEVRVRVFRFPTPTAEADGTLEWSATTAVTVEVRAGAVTGLGWTYSSGAAAAVVSGHLAEVVTGSDPQAISVTHDRLRRACRNLGTRGLVGQAISAVDVALWDLRARLTGQPLVSLLGGDPAARVPVYGSGGFTTYDDTELTEQVRGWLALGCDKVKIKVGESWGTNPSRDLARVRQLRDLVGADVDVMVDANGGYSPAQARRMGHAFTELGVVWFEEPVSSDDLAGLAAVRAAVDCDVAAGEYAADVYDAAALCPVVDCLQLDATRCGGYTGWRAAAAVASAHGLQVSAHCAPALHAPVAAATTNLRHVEYFADHARLEPLLLTGVAAVVDGHLPGGEPVPGHGLSLHPDVDRFEVT